MKKQPQNPVMAQASKKPKVKPNGTYVSVGNRVGRIYPIQKDMGTYESMDTSGYSRGKKNYPLKKDGRDIGTISRKDVPAKIEEYKKGATAELTNKGFKAKK
jgi:hypothetical protein